MGLCLAFALTAEAGEYETVSPDGKLRVEVRTGGGTDFEVWYHGERVLRPSPAGMHLSDGTWVGGGEVTSVKKNRVRETIDVVVGKNRTLREAYNELVLSLCALDEVSGICLLQEEDGVMSRDADVLRADQLIYNIVTF